jgi:hypothetical protein
MRTVYLWPHQLYNIFLHYTLSYKRYDFRRKKKKKKEEEEEKEEEK